MRIAITIAFTLLATATAVAQPPADDEDDTKPTATAPSAPAQAPATEEDAESCPIESSTVTCDATVPEPSPPPAPTTTEVYTPPPAEPAPAPPPEHEHHESSWPGIALTVGGGVSGFTGDTLRDTTDDGGDWVARATIGVRSLLSFEAAYIGSAQGIDALGIDTSAYLVGNGLSGALRLNGASSYPVTPFIFGGAAWRHYTLENSDFNTSAISDSDDVFEFPMGVGLSTTMKGFLIDLRGEFDYVVDSDMVPNLDDDGNFDINDNDDGADMHRYGVTLTVGVSL